MKQQFLDTRHQTIILKKKETREVPDGLVVRTQHFHHCGLVQDLVWELRTCIKPLHTTAGGVGGGGTNQMNPMISCQALAREGERTHSPKVSLSLDHAENSRKSRQLDFTRKSIRDEGAALRESPRDLQRVSLKALAECWSVYSCEETTQSWRRRKKKKKTHLKGEEQEILRVHLLTRMGNFLI